ncbi:ribosomal protein L34-domain-containing protein, partial [Bipolaris maydis]
PASLTFASSLLCSLSTPSQARQISLLSPRRPLVPATYSPPSTLAPPGSSSSFANPETLDLVGRISAHPALGSTQIRCGPRDTYNPSHLVRKRRHGFLSRLRTKKGRKMIMRRLKKGRWNISH